MTGTLLIQTLAGVFLLFVAGCGGSITETSQAPPADGEHGHTHKHGGHGSSTQPAEPTDPDRKLYLTPGGKYTAADIEANGKQTASEKYRGFRAAHDLKPAPGERVCPVTLTKANPACTWVVGGKTYEFCCPPCIDEFVALAKEHPDQIKEPAAYRKKP